MFRKLFFICFIINIRTSSYVIDEVYKTAAKVWNLYNIIDNSELISQNIESSDDRNDPIIQELKKQLNEIHEKLNKLENLIGPKRIRNVLKSWPLTGLLIWKIDTFDLFIENIDEYYKNFHHCINASHCSFTSFQLIMEEAFENLESDIGIIREIATNEKKSQLNKEDLIAMLTGFSKGRLLTACETTQMTSNLLMNLFRIIMVAEVKANIMIAYSNIYKYVKNEDKAGYRRIISLEREKLEKQFVLYINVFLINLPVTDVIYNRACDPPNGNWIRDETFYELEKNFQPILFSYEYNKCGFDECKEVLYFESNKCNIKIYAEAVGNISSYAIDGCVDLHSIKTCILNDDLHKYLYIDSEESGFFGKNESCPRDGEEIDSRYWGPSHFSTCACNMYSSQNKISLLMMESDMDSNKIITGVRFIRVNKTLWIQPRQGKLESEGFINKTSQEWISIPETVDSSIIEIIHKEDSVFFLDDVILSAKLVLTGIKFEKVTRKSVTGFAIKIFGTFFNYDAGVLFTSDYKISQAASNAESGQRLSVFPVSSIFTKQPHEVTVTAAKYVSLTASRFEEDIGQSTLPLFDAVPVTLEEPLSGIGLFHKNVLAYAGFISLRIYGTQFTGYFNDFKSSYIIDDRVVFNDTLN